ncbi:MAG: hypothetical protein JO033_17400 [Acidobacteriaceae bacterium]|nr:hypothetical protein [Acidobacteriaceae bacterium]MBV9501998.1 hypothetical protein [Acidobacteriaceae bacterium]
MRKFVFELDSVLRLRRQQLQAEEGKLRALLAERRRLEQVRASLETEGTDAAEYIHAFQSPSVGDLRALASHKLGLQAREKTLAASIEANEHAIEVQTSTVIRAKRNEKLLAKLRNRRLADWIRDVDRATEAEIQEAWTALWNRS